MRARELKLRIECLLNGTAIESGVKFVNPSGIKFGTSCVLETGSYFKGAITGEVSLIFGNRVRVMRFARVSAPKSQIQIGDDSFIGHNVWIGGKGNIKVGKNSMISINSVVVSSNHDYENITIPYIEGREIPKEINIGDNVWIGSNCVILPGTNIGNGAVVAAGSIILEDVPENTLVAGTPARPKKAITRK